MVANRLLLLTVVAGQPPKAVVAGTQLQIFKTTPGPLLAIPSGSTQ